MIRDAICLAPLGGTIAGASKNNPAPDGCPALRQCQVNSTRPAGHWQGKNRGSGPKAGLEDRPALIPPTPVRKLDTQTPMGTSLLPGRQPRSSCPPSHSRWNGPSVSQSVVGQTAS